MRFALQSAARPALFLPRAVPSSSRKFTLPAPETVPKEGETSTFVVRCESIIDNPATALRLVRAVEKELGPVIKIDLPKDQDMRRGFKFMSVQTLRPAALSEPIRGELPASYVDKDVHSGGVSLTDVMAALGAEKRSRRSTTEVPRLSYTVNARDTPIQVRRRVPPRPTAAQKQEDSRIVSALRQLDSGFYGGFAGLADQFEGLEMPAEARPPVNAARVKKADKARALPQEKESGPRKSFAEIVAEQREAKLAAFEAAVKKAEGPVKKEQVREVQEEEEEDVVAMKKERLQRAAIERARKAAAAQQSAEAQAQAEAQTQEEETRRQQEAAKQAEQPKKKGWF